MNMLLKSLAQSSLLCGSLFFSTLTKAESSNRNEVRASLGKNYHIVFGKNFTEADWAKGLYAMGQSIAAKNPGPFLAWFEQELEANLIKIQAKMPEIGMNVLRQWILQSLQQKRVIVYNGFRIHAGYATYNRWQSIIYHEPQTYECKVPLLFGGWTSGVCTTMVKKERRISLPNHNQFFVRFQFNNEVPTDSTQNYHRIYVHNSCNRSLFVAARYRNLNNDWVNDGFWKLDPGQEAYVVNTNNNIIYFSGVSTDGKIYWSGDYKFNVRGRTYGFFKVDMKQTRFVKWTQNLVCDSNQQYRMERDETTGDIDAELNGQEGGEVEQEIQQGQGNGGGGGGGNNNGWDNNTGDGQNDGWNNDGSAGSGGTGENDGWGNGSNSAGSDGWDAEEPQGGSEGWGNAAVRYSSGLSDWDSAPDDGWDNIEEIQADW